MRGEQELKVVSTQCKGNTSQHLFSPCSTDSALRVGDLLILLESPTTECSKEGMKEHNERQESKIIRPVLKAYSACYAGRAAGSSTGGPLEGAEGQATRIVRVCPQTLNLLREVTDVERRGQKCPEKNVLSFC